MTGPADQVTNNRFLDLHQVAPRLGPRKPLFKIALNSVNDANRRPNNFEMAPNPTQTGEKGNGSKNIRDMINGDTNPNPNSRPTTPAVATATTATANKRLPPKLNIEEIIALKNEVIDTMSSKKYLTKTKLAVTGKPFTTDSLKETLLYITQLPGISLPAQTAVRAVAFLLEAAQAQKDSDITTETIARHITAAISPHIAKLQDVEEKITKSTAELDASITACNTQLEEVQTSIAKLAKQAMTATTTPPSKPSYATATTTGQQASPEKRAQHLQRAAREAIKECQLLIDFPATSQLAAGKSSHAQLVERIKKALDALPKDNAPELSIRSVNQLRQGGMILEMMTKEAAEHIRTNTNVKTLFLQNLDSEANVKERTYPVVIPFTPVAFQPENQSSIRQLEEENGWKTMAVMSA
ncbi:hypothetical protein BDR05DRAFT_953808 [Suillus weaverae]|nr:hypothetical protein BDR05DRAFT_953808 [Suillus weaverae]